MNTITLQNLFESRIFKIPNYQRGYSWEAEQIRDLLDDLESVRNFHYTGTIVMKKTDKKVEAFGETYVVNEIVDGQQRITSIIILLNEIARELQAINTSESLEIEKTLRDKYLQRKGQQKTIYKLELDQNNEFFFKDKILGKSDAYAEEKIKSHTLLKETQIQFSKYLKEKKTQDDFFSFLKNLIKKLPNI